MSKKLLSLTESGGSYNKSKFPERKTHKIFETNSSFHVKWRTTKNV